jgi:hypothetical protein
LEYVSSTAWSGIHDIVIRGHLAYCAFTHGLRILDITNPAVPVEVSSTYLTAGPTLGLDLVDTKVYAACYEGSLIIIDVNDPTEPQIIGAAATGFRPFAV